jgi:hypothetical protein
MGCECGISRKGRKVMKLDGFLLLPAAVDALVHDWTCSSLFHERIKFCLHA